MGCARSDGADLGRDILLLGSWWRTKNLDTSFQTEVWSGVLKNSISCSAGEETGRDFVNRTTPCRLFAVGYSGNLKLPCIPSGGCSSSHILPPPTVRCQLHAIGQPSKLVQAVTLQTHMSEVVGSNPRSTTETFDWPWPRCACYQWLFCNWPLLLFLFNQITRPVINYKSISNVFVYIVACWLCYLTLDDVYCFSSVPPGESSHSTLK